VTPLDEPRIAHDSRRRRVTDIAHGEGSVARTEWRDGTDRDDCNRLHG
jgi:hypothetical protein